MFPRSFRRHSLSTNGAARKAISLGRHLIRGYWLQHRATKARDEHLSRLVRYRPTRNSHLEPQIHISDSIFDTRKRQQGPNQKQTRILSNYYVGPHACPARNTRFIGAAMSLGVVPSSSALQLSIDRPFKNTCIAGNIVKSELLPSARALTIRWYRISLLLPRLVSITSCSPWKLTAGKNSSVDIKKECRVELMLLDENVEEKCDKRHWYHKA